MAKTAGRASGAGRAGRASGTGRAGRAGPARAATGAGHAVGAGAPGEVSKPAAAKKAKLPKAVTTTVRVALDKKGLDVVVLDLRKASGFTDYFVIVTGANVRQIHAIADAIEETL